jgi:hypothetical protein
MSMLLWCVWRATHTKRPLYIVCAAALAGLTAQFEIILTLWFMWLAILLVGFRTLPKLSIKTALLALAAGGVWYLPLVVFNVRHHWISFRSVLAYVAHHQAGQSDSLLRTLQSFGERQLHIVQSTFVFLPPVLLFCLFVCIGAGMLLLWQKNTALRPAVKILVLWLLMPLPALLFPKSLGLIQLYVGLDIGILVLIVLGLKGLSAALVPTPKLRGIVIAGFLLLCLWQLTQTLHKLGTNQDVFFATIQQGLSYADRVHALTYIREASAGQPYFFRAFTIPYFHEESWQYLWQLNPDDRRNPNADQWFVIIEPGVTVFWEEHWIADIDRPHLVEERQFGQIRVQHRQRATTPKANH